MKMRHDIGENEATISIHVTPKGYVLDLLFNGVNFGEKLDGERRYHETATEALAQAEDLLDAVLTGKS